MDFEERIQQVFEATEASLSAVYGAQNPSHFGTVIRWRDGGPDPLDGISVYWHPDGHWHFVGFGLAERAEKPEGTDPEISGWGFELTFRLEAPEELRAKSAAASSDDPDAVLELARAAPSWPIVMLNDLARYVFSSRRPLRHGDYFERSGAPVGARLGFVRDPGLSAVDTVNGRFEWLQAFTVTEAQLLRLKGDDYERFLEELQAQNPRLVSRVELDAEG